MIKNKQESQEFISDLRQQIIKQSVAILCDGNNIEKSIHAASKNNKTMIDFDAVIPKLIVQISIITNIK